MSVEHHPLLSEFPEHRDRIHDLKTSDAHFRRLFDEYHELDKTLYRMDKDIEPASDTTMESLKTRRLALKDDLLGMLKAAG
ncbi:MAG: YdcH family protein [Gammaproteobacteria bacterium]|nr:YdcH family protein [Gammaproteobacteria bacterium]